MLKKLVSTMIVLVNFSALAQPAWQNDIQVAGDGVSIDLIMAGHASATDVFDAGLDSLAPPEPPSDYYACFKIFDPTFDYLAKDVRGWVSPYTTEIDWILEVKNGDGIETTVTWDPSGWPAAGYFTLIDTILVNMRVRSDFTFTGNRIVILRYSYSAINAVLLNLNVLLEGPYIADGDTMSTALLRSGHIPTTSPYDDGHTVGSVPSDIIDWIFVELRSAADGDAETGRSFFLRKDGVVTDDDGSTTDLELPGVSDADYFIVVHHRNHLAVMSATAQSLNSSSALSYDFTGSSAQYYGGTNGAVELETDVWGMISSDANRNGEVQADDKESYWRIEVGLPGYKDSDFNLNGEVQADDKESYWRVNAGRGSQVP